MKRKSSYILLHRRILNVGQKITVELIAGMKNVNAIIGVMTYACNRKKR